MTEIGMDGNGERYSDGSRKPGRLLYKVEFEADSPDEAKAQMRRLAEFVRSIKGRNVTVTDLRSAEGKS